MEMLSKHFALKEFGHADKGNVLPPEAIRGNIRHTLDFLERLRFLMNIIILQKKDAFKEDGKIKRGTKYPDIGIQVTPNGGYRHDPTKSKTSRHYHFQAVDVRPVGLYTHGFSYEEFYQMCELVDQSFPNRPYRLGKYLGYSGSEWVHVDCAFGYGGRRWTHYNR